MKLAIVTSLQNERENIIPLLDRFAEFSDKYDFSLTCVDNLSTDGGADVFKDAIASDKYPFLKSFIRITPDTYRGYGHGIMSGVCRAAQQDGTDVIAWTHSDLQTDPADVFAAFETYLNHANRGETAIVVKGRRVKRKLGDTLFSFGMAAISSVVLRTPLYEINAQPKLFHKNFLKYLEHAPDDFSLDLYLLYQARRYHIPIVSIPVLFHKRIHGESKWATSFVAKKKIILRTIKYIWALRQQDGRQP